MHKFKRFRDMYTKRWPGCRRSASTSPACWPSGSSSRHRRPCYLQQRARPGDVAPAGLLRLDERV